MIRYNPTEHKKLYFLLNLFKDINKKNYSYKYLKKHKQTIIIMIVISVNKK